VTGLESIRRLPSVRLNLTQALYDQAAADLAKRPAAVAAKRELAIHPAARALTKPPAATDFSWAGDGVASWSYDTRRSAEATWTFDAQNLYLCFRNVADTTPMVNGGKIVRQLFKTGDAAVCELRTVPDNDTPGVIEGDLRLLFSVFEGKPVTVLYRYKVAGTAKPEEFASPVTTTAIDVVKVLDNAAVAVDRQPGGYTVRVAVPLAELGFAPEPGHRYRGDFGIVHSDAKGTANELRMYWSNQATGLVADLALEAAIEPGRWGTFAVSAK
jgi:hypothetical protein